MRIRDAETSMGNSQGISPYRGMYLCTRQLHLFWHLQDCTNTVSTRTKQTVMLPTVLQLMSGETRWVALFRWSKHPNSTTMMPAVLALPLANCWVVCNHFDDFAVNGRYNKQRRYNYMSRSIGIPLPRERLHSHIVDTGLTRPTPHPSRR